MDVEITKELVADLFATIYEKQAEKYGGETTLNELRVIACCYRAFTYNTVVSITLLSSSLDIPTSTVHRAVSNLIEKGWLVDRPHPSDGRKRVITLSEQGVSGGLWELVANLIKNHPVNAKSQVT